MNRLVLALLIALASVSDAGASIRPGRYAIGDSVMLGAKPNLVARGFHVNTAVSRQFGDAIPIVRAKVQDGSLRRRLVIHLGTNGVLIDPDDCDAIARLAGRRRHVYLVTIKIPRWYRSVQNDRMRACARRHANTTLIDWYAYSHDHPGWFADDDYHLNPVGRVRYAAFLDAKTS